MGKDQQRGLWKFVANCRAEVINPSRVVQRSVESIFAPKFSAHLIGPNCSLRRFSLLGQFESAYNVATGAANCDKTTLCPGLPSG